MDGRRPELREHRDGAVARDAQPLPLDEEQKRVFAAQSLLVHRYVKHDQMFRGTHHGEAMDGLRRHAASHSMPVHMHGQHEGHHFFGGHRHHRVHHVFLLPAIGVVGVLAGLTKRRCLLFILFALQVVAGVSLVVGTTMLLLHPERMPMPVPTHRVVVGSLIALACLALHAFVAVKLHLAVKAEAVAQAYAAVASVEAPQDGTVAHVVKPDPLEAYDADAADAVVVVSAIKVETA